MTDPRYTPSAEWRPSGRAQGARARTWIFVVAIFVILGLLVVLFTAPYSVSVVNMIPAEFGAEEGQNPEPSIAINPKNVSEIVGGGLYLGLDSGCSRQTFGVLRTTDGGKTWALHCTLEMSETYAMGDPSYAFSGDGTQLIAAAQTWGSSMQMWIFSTTPGPDPVWPVTSLISSTDPTLDGAHVPWVATSPSDTSSFVAIGLDSWSMDTDDCNSGVIWSNFGHSTFFRNVCVSTRGPVAEQSVVWTPVVRTAVHSNGTAYAATYRMTDFPGAVGGIFDVVVFRNNPDSSMNMFSDLTDASSATGPCDPRDGESGFRVACSVEVPFDQTKLFGGEGRTYTHVALAVDPNDSEHVFVAWGDTVGQAAGMTLHLRESTDGGKSWGNADAHTMDRSLNPALAVNSRGVLAFAFQRLSAGNRWETSVQLFGPGAVAGGLFASYKLSTHDAAGPLSCILPYLGDYMDLKAVGATFYGAFSASSDLSASNFPEGVTYARQVHTPLVEPCPADAEDGELNVDPYFYSIRPKLLVGVRTMLSQHVNLKKF